MKLFDVSFECLLYNLKTACMHIIEYVFLYTFLDDIIWNLDDLRTKLMTGDFKHVLIFLYTYIHFNVLFCVCICIYILYIIHYILLQQNNIRKNILEFSGFPFEENSNEYMCRRTLMEQ